ncbi:MAG: histidine phosphatase family protein [Microthrixaceae bacterium]
MKPTEVLVVRHGQSEWNALGRWQGQEDPPLTQLGRSQAADAARAVGAIDAVFASPLQRASLSAQIIADHVGVAPVVVLDGLMERDAGEWQGLTRDEIEAQWPGYLAAGDRPPSWEPDQHVEARALGSIEAMASSVPGGSLLAVAHAGIIYALERALDGAFSTVANLEGRRFTYDGNSFTLGERVHLLSDETVPGQI